MKTEAHQAHGESLLILFAAAGKHTPYVNGETEDKIVRTFMMIDRFWCCIDRDRRNTFLSYLYMLLKLLELTGQTDLVPQVSVLRARLRLRQRDFIWKKVCGELGWTWKQTDIAYTNQSVKSRQGAYKRTPEDHV